MALDLRGADMDAKDRDPIRARAKKLLLERTCLHNYIDGRLRNGIRHYKCKGLGKSANIYRNNVRCTRIRVTK